MEAILAASKGDLTAASIDDLQRALRVVFEDKVSPSKAEHISFSCGFPPGVVLDLLLSESENDAVEASSHIDPSLGGVNLSASAGQGQSLNGGRLARRISVSDAALNQPQDDPALQRAVAKHVINAISEVDASSWNAHAMLRGSQGWTFTY